MSEEVLEVEEADAFSVLGEALETAAERFGDLTAGARDTARSAARSVQKNVGVGVYKGSYGLSFGLVFSAVFLTELLPDGSALRRGLTDGAHAGLESAKSKRRSAQGHLSEEEPELGDDLAPPPARQKRVLAAPVQKSAPSPKKRG